MKSLSLTIAFLLLSSCAALHSDDPTSLAFDIPKGSTLSLNKSLTIGDSDTHVSIQNGKQINDKMINHYAINCRLDFRTFGPREIQPEIFSISRTEDGTQWISQPAIMRFYTEVHLTSTKNTDVILLECQEYGDSIDNNFTVAEMQVALGDIITIQFAKE